MSKATEYAKRHTQLRDQEAQLQAEGKAMRFASKDGPLFEITQHGDLAVILDKATETLSREDAVRLLTWMIETFSHSPDKQRDALLAIIKESERVKAECDKLKDWHLQRITDAFTKNIKQRAEAAL